MVSLEWSTRPRAGTYHTVSLGMLEDRFTLFTTKFLGRVREHDRQGGLASASNDEQEIKRRGREGRTNGNERQGHMDE